MREDPPIMLRLYTLSMCEPL